MTLARFNALRRSLEYSGLRGVQILELLQVLELIVIFERRNDRQHFLGLVL